MCEAKSYLFRRVLSRKSGEPAAVNALAARSMDAMIHFPAASDNYAAELEMIVRICKCEHNRNIDFEIILRKRSAHYHRFVDWSKDYVFLEQQLINEVSTNQEFRQLKSTPE